MRPFPLLAMAGAGALALSACVTMPPPVAEVAAARASVAQAQPGAARHAPEQLLAARTKLARAEDAMVRHDYAQALRLAQQAEVDARLAEATADAARMRLAVEEVNAGISELKRRTGRTTP